MQVCQADELVDMNPEDTGEVLILDLLDEVRAFLPDEDELNLSDEQIMERVRLETQIQQQMIQFLRLKQACCQKISSQTVTDDVTNPRPVSDIHLAE